MVHLKSTLGHSKQEKPKRQMQQLPIHPKMRRLQSNSLRPNRRLPIGGPTMLEKNGVSDKIMRLADNVFLYRLDEELMWLFNTDTGEYWNLNETSYFALSQFDGKKTLDEFSQLYTKKYLEHGVNEEELMEDFKKLTTQFIATNIIVNQAIVTER